MSIPPTRILGGSPVQNKGLSRIPVLRMCDSPLFYSLAIVFLSLDIV